MSNIARFRDEDARNSLEDDIRNLHRDRDGHRGVEDDNEVVALNIDATLQRVSSMSLSGIDNLVADLQMLRDHLADEGERVKREVAQYTLLSRSSIQSTRVIAESMAHLKDTFDLRNSRR